MRRPRVVAVIIPRRRRKPTPSHRVSPESPWRHERETDENDKGVTPGSKVVPIKEQREGFGGVA